MMNTLLSINNYYYNRGGAESVFFEHNQIFDELNWKVIPFSMKHDKNYKTPWDKYFVETLEFGDEYNFFQKLTRAQKIIYSFEARKNVKLLSSVENIDIAHFHNIYHHLSPSFLSGLKQQGIPVVMTCHDLKIACPAYKMLTHDGICERCKGGNLINVVKHRCIKGSVGLSALVVIESLLHQKLRLYKNNVDFFVVPSRFYRDKLIEWGFDAAHFRYIPNFVDISKFEERTDVSQSFVFFGRLAPEKGLSTLLKAASVAGVSLVIIGSGPEEMTLKKQAEDLSLDVKFISHCEQAELKKHVCTARAVVLPSEWYENAPMSILEANAMGVPVIGANIGGIPEMIKEGHTGHIFESKSSNALSEVLRLYADKPMGEVLQMSGPCRDWIREQFSRERYVQKMTELYTELGVS